MRRRRDEEEERLLYSVNYSLHSQAGFVSQHVSPGHSGPKHTKKTKRFPGQHEESIS